MADKPILDPAIKKEIKRITSKSFEALTKDDIAFLKARISYLNPGQLETYASVLKVKKDKK